MAKRQNEFYISETKYNFKGDTQFRDGYLNVTSDGKPAPWGTELKENFEERFTPLVINEFNGTLEVISPYRDGISNGMTIKVTGHPSFPEFIAFMNNSLLFELITSPNFSSGIYKGKIGFHQHGRLAFVKNIDENSMNTMAPTL